MVGKIGVIGFGNIGTAILQGLIAKGVPPAVLYAHDKRPEQMQRAEALRINMTKTNAELVKNSDIIIIAVKPPNMKEVLTEIAPVIDDKLVISVAAAITIDFIEKHLKTARVVRVMPNAPALIGEGAAAFACGAKVTEDDEHTVIDIFKSMGMCFKVDNDHLIDTVTALSGCGPAYTAYLMNFFVEEAVKSGLPRDIAFKLAAQTVIGAGKLMLALGKTPEEVIKSVMTKGGATELALGIFEKRKIGKIIAEAFKASEERSRDMSK